jgi:WD40 repeat protein
MMPEPTSVPKTKPRWFALLVFIGVGLLVAIVVAFQAHQKGGGSTAVRVRSYSLSETEPPTPTRVEIRALDFSRQGSLLALGLSNDTILLWRLTDERPQTLGAIRTGLKPRDRIDTMAVAIAAAAPEVAIGVEATDLDAPQKGTRGRIRLWNFETEKSRDIWESKAGFGRLAISPKGQSIATWDAPHRPLQLIDCPSAKVLWTDTKVEFRFSALTFSSEGRYLAAGVDREVRIYESHTGKLVRRCTGRMGSQESIAFSPDGSRIVTGGADRTIHLWGLHDAKQDREIPIKFPERRNENIEAVVFTPDSQTVLAFIPKFEKSSWLDRLWVQSDVDSFHHVGTLAVSHTLSRNVTTPILDADLLFSRACFCPDSAEFAMSTDDGRTVEIWRY